MRDATDSWSGYLYQSIIGLIVVMEHVLEYQESGQQIHGELVYEDHEDFSIYLKDQNGQPVASKTYQVKFKKSATPSDYYPFFRDLLERRESNQGIEHFLNISTGVDFSQVDHERNRLPENFVETLHTYRNDQAFLGGIEAFSYLEELISTFVQSQNLEFTQSKIERATSTLIAFIDKAIIKTKDMRVTNAEYREIIQLNSLLDIIRDIPEELTEEIVVQVIRKRMLSAFYIFCDPCSDEEVVALEEFISCISKMDDRDFISFTKKIEIHKDLSSLIELVSAFKNPEDLQEVLLKAVKSIKSSLEMEGVIFKKQNVAYRPSTMRMSTDERMANQNLKSQYIPLIKRNMSLYDVEGYFQTKKIIISGNTVENIWEYIITASHSEKKENKINEPELKALISISEAIGELNEDE